LGAALAKGAFRSIKHKMDPEEHGGAPLLGLNGNVIKVHGSPDSSRSKTQSARLHRTAAQNHEQIQTAVTQANQRAARVIELAQHLLLHDDAATLGKRFKIHGPAWVQRTHLLDHLGGSYVPDECSQMPSWKTGRSSDEWIISRTASKNVASLPTMNSLRIWPRTPAPARDAERRHHRRSDRPDHRSHHHYGYAIFPATACLCSTSSERDAPRLLTWRRPVQVHLRAGDRAAVHHVAHVQHGAGDWRGEAFQHC